MKRGCFMDSKSFYMSLPHDISGSRTKNRFRLELLWGISKILDLIENDDFTVVFDYACDIEVHIKDGFEFYQIKTRSGTASYTQKSLTKVDGENSILGKLYLLNSSNPSFQTKLAIVSNSPLSDGPIRVNNEEICFNSLSLRAKNEMEASLKKELSLSSIDLSNVYFLHTNFDFANPQNEIIGKLCVSFEKIKNCEPTNPNALYRLIYETVSDKACYEYTSEEYNKLIALKGITKAEFEDILETHTNNAKTGIRQTEQYIDSLSDIQARRKYKKVLPSVMKQLCTSHYFKNLEREIGIFLISNSNRLKEMELILDALIQEFHNRFPKEISNEEKVVFYIIIVHRFIEGVYDQ